MAPSPITRSSLGRQPGQRLRGNRSYRYGQPQPTMAPPASSQSGRLRRSSGSLVDFRGGRAAAFLMSAYGCEIRASRYF
jgi:hypothetical protein